MEKTAINRPRPDTRGAGKAYWKAAGEGRLDIPRCRSCGQVHWYPRVHCPHCGAAELEWMTASGHGRIHTFTVVRNSGDPYFKTKVPYVLAMIDLDEGVRIMSNLPDCDPASVRVGAEVDVFFEKVDDDVAVPLFKLRLESR